MNEIQDIKNIVIGFMVLATLLSVTACTPSAKRVHRYHYRTHRTVRRHRHHISNGKFAQIVDHQLYFYINRARREHHERPLKLNVKLNKVAWKRSRESAHAYATEPYKFIREQENGHVTNSDNWIHDIHNGQPICWKYSQKLGLNGCAENVAPIELGTLSQYNLGHVYVLRNHTPKEVAWNIFRDEAERDQFDHNGHAKNLFDKNARIIGISVYFHNKDMNHKRFGEYAPINGAIAEEFD